MLKIALACQIELAGLRNFHLNKKKIIIIQHVQLQFAGHLKRLVPAAIRGDSGSK